MSWNFPFNSQEWREFATQCLNFLKTEVEQLKKQQPSTPENLLGVPIGGPLSADMVDLPFEPDPPGGDGGGGSGDRNFVIGKTTVSISKYSAGDVDVWYWNGSAHTTDTSEPNITAYSLFADLPAGRYVACSKDVDTGKWYITAAECG